jgi:hypothetical protein
MSVDIGLTCIFQASDGTTCVKYLEYLEGTRVFVTE